jgi:hypothetical protein
MSDVFKYDDQSSYESNFSRWLQMNAKERRDNGDEPHTEIVAKRIFSEQYGRKSIKETISGLLKDR